MKNQVNKITICKLMLLFFLNFIGSARGQKNSKFEYAFLTINQAYTGGHGSTNFYVIRMSDLSFFIEPSLNGYIHCNSNQLDSTFANTYYSNITKVNKILLKKKPTSSFAMNNHYVRFWLFSLKNSPQLIQCDSEELPKYPLSHIISTSSFYLVDYWNIREKDLFHDIRLESIIIKELICK